MTRGPRAGLAISCDPGRRLHLGRVGEKRKTRL